MSEHAQTIREVLFARSQDIMRDKALAALEQLQDEIAAIRAEALREAADRAVECYIKLMGGRVPVDEAELRSAILAGEVKNG